MNDGLARTSKALCRAGGGYIQCPVSNPVQAGWVCSSANGSGSETSLEASATCCGSPLPPILLDFDDLTVGQLIVPVLIYRGLSFGNAYVTSQSYVTLFGGSADAVYSPPHALYNGFGSIPGVINAQAPGFFPLSAYAAAWTADGATAYFRGYDDRLRVTGTITQVIRTSPPVFVDLSPLGLIRRLEWGVEGGGSTSNVLLDDLSAVGAYVCGPCPRSYTSALS